MVPGGRIAIIESLIGDRDDPGVAALMDLNMLAMATGKERTLAEYDALLAKAGLRRTAVRTSDSPQSIVETVAAPMLSVPLYDDHGGSLGHFRCRREFGLRAFIGTTNVATYGGATGDGPAPDRTTRAS
jgi:hypothetical protein